MTTVDAGSSAPGAITWAQVGLGGAAFGVLPAAPTRSEHGDLPRLVAILVIWVGIPFTLLPLADEHINWAITGMLNGATPFFAGLWGALYFDRTPRCPQLAGLAVGCAGLPPRRGGLGLVTRKGTQCSWLHPTLW